MLKQLETHQYAPSTKRRIGRSRFLLEFIIAAIVMKIGYVAYTTRRELFTIAILLFGIGYFLAIWASVKRLRDISRSEWWVTILIFPLLLGVVAGIAISILGPDGFGNSVPSTFKIAYWFYLIIYCLLLGVLSIWPSTYSNRVGVAGLNGNHLGHAAANREALTIATDQSVFGSAGNHQDSLSKYHLNGWQRLWVFLTILWLPAVAFLDYKYWPSQDGERVAGCVIPGNIFSYVAPTFISKELIDWRHELPTNLAFDSEEPPPPSEAAPSKSEILHANLSRIFGDPIEDGGYLQWFPNWRGDPLGRPEWSNAKEVKPYCKNLIKRLELSGRAEQMRKANSKAMLMHRIKWFAIEFTKWIVPAVIVYLLGLAIVWVSRGFRKSR